MCGNQNNPLVPVIDVLQYFVVKNKAIINGLMQCIYNCITGNINAIFINGLPQKIVLRGLSRGKMHIGN